MHEIAVGKAVQGRRGGLYGDQLVDHSDGLLAVVKAAVAACDALDVDGHTIDAGRLCLAARGDIVSLSQMSSGWRRTTNPVMPSSNVGYLELVDVGCCGQTIQSDGVHRSLCLSTSRTPAQDRCYLSPLRETGGL
jgi:hypothetical protein